MADAAISGDGVVLRELLTESSTRDLPIEPNTRDFPIEPIT
jgi:hypothetical protein